MLTAAGAPTDAPHVLVALGGVLRKVDPGTEHTTDVGMALVKPVVNDVVDKRRP